MKLLDHIYATPAENLACEEALLELAETSGGEGVLRFWESPDYFVVVGYSNKIATEVDVEVCRADGISIYRRCSGGGTVLQGPGCYNYALVIPAPSENVTETNRFIMERNRAAMEKLLGMPVNVQGFTDLTADGRKFSGNSQRRKRRYVLFHGTFLYKFDLALIAKYLRMPSKQPDYRQSRPHTDFVRNIVVTPAAIREAMLAAWGVTGRMESLPAIDAAKYNSAEWIWKF